MQVAKIESQAGQQLSLEFKQRAKYLSSNQDWQELNKQIDLLKNKEISLKQEINSFQKLDKLYPNYPALKLILAGLYYKDGNIPKARQMVSQASRLDPNNPLIKKLDQLINPS